MDANGRESENEVRTGSVGRGGMLGRVLMLVLPIAAVALLVGCASTAEVARQAGRNAADSTSIESNSTAAASNAVVYIECPGYEVRKPGVYPWRNGVTLTDLIKAAGGLTAFVDRPHIAYVYRGDKHYSFRYESILSGEINDVFLRPGDKVSVIAPTF